MPKVRSKRCDTLVRLSCGCQRYTEQVHIGRSRRQKPAEIRDLRGDLSKSSPGHQRPLDPCEIKEVKGLPGNNGKRGSPPLLTWFNGPCRSIVLYFLRSFTTPLAKDVGSGPWSLLADPMDLQFTNCVAGGFGICPLSTILPHRLLQLQTATRVNWLRPRTCNSSLAPIG